MTTDFQNNKWAIRKETSKNFENKTHDTRHIIVGRT